MENQKLLASFVAALAINEFIHIIFEIWSIRQKVSWLAARMDKKPHGEWPISIDNLAKTLALHLVLFFLFVGVLYFGLTILELSTNMLLQLSVVALIVTYSYTVFGMDAYHTEIARIMKRYKK